MAEVAISYALKTTSNLAIQKVCFLLDVEQQVELLKGELQMSQCLLNDADAAEKQDYDNRMRQWISDIRKVAQEAADAIETFMLKVDTRSSRGPIGRCLSFPIYLYHLIRVGQKIQSIQDELKEVKTRLQEYKNPTIDNAISPTPSANTQLWRQLSLRQDDKHPVGLKEDVIKIERVICDDTKGRSIVSIAGMGGIGKSTLARIVYNQAAATNRFDCHAWVFVSWKFNPQEIIMELMRQLIGPNPEKPSGSEESQFIRLKTTLQEHLQPRQYFIVIDDVWESAHWKRLESAFPDNKDKASRLLLTSRRRNIAATRYVHPMKPLAPEDSWQLFLTKAFPHNNDGTCLNNLESTGKKILERCNGLPLAITKVAEILANLEPTLKEWEDVFKAISFYMGSNTVEGILGLSYHYLSPQLKSCFLCLGFFNENAPIPAEKLVQVWIAEGMVSHDGGEETAEEIARRYLDDLINQNIIQVMERTVDDRVKKCRVQELLLKLCIKKATEEISFEILKEQNSQSSTKSRHRSFYCSPERFAYLMNQNKRLRSLFFHRLGNVNCSPPDWNSFELLRVLDFEGFGLEILPGTIGALIGLRYLGLRNNKIRRLPRSVGRLKKLEVLDIALNFIVEFPTVIWKLDSLRHLYMSGISCKVPLKIDMKNLQTLLYIPVAYWKPEQMTSLQKLGIELDENTGVSELFTSLAKLPKLVHLNLKWSYKQSMASMSGLGILQGLTKLKLHGSLTTLPSASDFPPNLSCLSLVETYLDEDPMPKLEKLKELRYLKLHQAYTGPKMEISNNGFPRLNILSLRKLLELRDLDIGIGAMSELKRLEINECQLLETLPEEVRVMSNLQELKMVTTKEIASKLRGEDSYKISRLQSVDIIGY